MHSVCRVLLPSDFGFVTGLLLGCGSCTKSQKAGVIFQREWEEGFLPERKIQDLLFFRYAAERSRKAP